MTISLQVSKLPIETPEDHQAVLARIDALLDAEPASADAVELKVLAILCAQYESTAFPIDPPSPIDAIRFRMEQARYSQADLARVLGSRSRASEILNGKVRTLSVTQIRRLHAAWHIPVEVLIREPGKAV
jgi:HTH-type transcriptional regulator/antitoxin HigA